MAPFQRVQDIFCTRCYGKYTIIHYVQKSVYQPSTWNVFIMLSICFLLINIGRLILRRKWKFDMLLNCPRSRRYTYLNWLFFFLLASSTIAGAVASQGGPWVCSCSPRQYRKCCNPPKEKKRNIYPLNNEKWHVSPRRTHLSPPAPPPPHQNRSQTRILSKCVFAQCLWTLVLTELDNYKNVKTCLQGTLIV